MKRQILLGMLILWGFLLWLGEPVLAATQKVTAQVNTNLRSGPGTNYKKVGLLPGGSSAQVIKEQNKWYYIKKNNGQMGWVAGWLVKVSNLPEVSRGQNPSENKIVLVTGSKVNIRQGPGLNYQVIFKADRQSVFPFINTQQGWHQIRLPNGQSGWIISTYSQVKIQGNTTGSPPSQGNNGITSSKEPQEKSGLQEGIPAAPVNNYLLAGKKIVLDPGHGGADPGAIGGRGLREKEVNLAIALRVRAYLEEMGAQVVLTREDDRYLALQERAALANNLPADIFVSIHANANPDPNLAGTSTYYYQSGQPNRDSASLALARLVQEAMVNEVGRRNIGVLTGNFLVIRETTMPAILVETAFLTNGEEEMLLGDEAIQDRFALAIARGIASYFSLK